MSKRTMNEMHERAIQQLQRMRQANVERGDIRGVNLMDAAIQLVPDIPLSLAGMPFCNACENVLCGACGDCHSFDTAMNEPDCPNDNDTWGGNCAAWWQAFKEVYHARYVEHAYGK